MTTSEKPSTNHPNWLGTYKPRPQHQSTGGSNSVETCDGTKQPQVLATTTPSSEPTPKHPGHLPFSAEQLEAIYRYSGEVHGLKKHTQVRWFNPDSGAMEEGDVYELAG